MCFWCLARNIIIGDAGFLCKNCTAILKNVSMGKSVLDMGSDFHELVIVEGLEDDDVIEAIYHLGCRYGQGYGISPPMAPELFPQWYSGYRLKVHACAQTKDLVSDLGVLAYHWMSTRGGQSASKYPLHSCLITRWLVAQGLEGSEAAHWHEQCHGGEDHVEASRKFIDWLVKRVGDANIKRQMQS